MTANAARQLKHIVGENVRTLRRGHGGVGMTQEELAERARLSVSFVSMIERAERAPHLDSLESIAEVFGVPPHQLLLDTTGVRTPMDVGTQLAVDRLTEFCRTRSLTSSEVGRLNGVAVLMFAREVV